MSDQTKLIIGLPSGSLADATRGGSLNVLLREAGFETSGYDKGGPSKFTTVNFLMGWDGRPQEFGSQLEVGEIDIAITGDDWVRERAIELEVEYGKQFRLERVLSLDRGGVKIVGICNDTSVEKHGRRFCAKSRRRATSSLS